MFLTAGSSIGRPDLPIWCDTLTRMDISLFPWNKPVGAYSLAPARSYFYIYVGTTLASSYMANDDDSGKAYPLCEN